MASSSTSTTASGPAGQEAVVLGGGMAGLLAAAVLARSYGQVTLVERDPLRTDATPRRGVPQGRHVHVLLSRGAAAIEEILPGLLSELTSEGGVTTDNLSEVHFEVNGHVLCQDDSTSDPTYLQSRPFLESRVLARVRGLANVRVLDGHDVVDLLWDTAGTKVIGAAVAPRSGPGERVELGANLVVSALGRNGRVGGWLTRHGYDEPPEEELRIDLVYASRSVRLDPASMGRYRAVLVGATPARPVGVAILRQEHDTWILTVQGFAGHHPPADPDEWLETAARLTPPPLAAAVRGAEPVTDLSAHRFPANLWRRYDTLDRFPDGLVVTGDSVCSFNPIYGQGMTVAALEAQVLGDLVGSGPQELAPRFFKQASRYVRVAWQSAVGGDLAMPADVVPGRRPVPVRLVNAYLDRYLEAAERDQAMTWSFRKVTGLERPARDLFTPHALRRVARTARPRALAGRGAPGGRRRAG
jgi:2-polyprenyl-6-methoxyphenol hydroxylase-like FAD-dependent oxidoreductase